MKCLIALLVLSFTSLSYAKPMSFDEVVRRYVSLSPTISGAEAVEKSTQARVSEGRSQFWPSLSLNGAYVEQKSLFYLSGTPLSSKQDLYTSSLKLEQPIYLGGRVHHEFARRKEEAERAKYNVIHTKNQSISTIIRSVALWISLRDQIHVLRESQKTQKNFVDITRKKRERGAVLSFDLDQVEAEFLSYEPRIENLRQQLISLEQGLAVELGLDPEGVFDFKWPVQMAPLTHLQVGPWFKEALTNRADYLMAVRAVDLARRSKKIEMGEEYPSLAFSGEYGYLSEAVDDHHTDSSNQFHTYALSLTIPLFSGFSSMYRSRAAEQLVVKSDRERRALEISIEGELRQALIQLKSAQNVLEQTQKWAEKASRALTHGLNSYRVGRVTIAQVVQLQGGQERAELGLINAQQALQMADLNWQLAKGTPLQEYYTGGSH